MRKPEFVSAKEAADAASFLLRIPPLTLKSAATRREPAGFYRRTAPHRSRLARLNAADDRLGGRRRRPPESSAAFDFDLVAWRADPVVVTFRRNGASGSVEAGQSHERLTF